jgi:uncharacterized protein YbjT (DUF2867 family)
VGATGSIGAAVVRALIARGHHVIGSARSDASKARHELGWVPKHLDPESAIARSISN